MQATRYPAIFEEKGWNPMLELMLIRHFAPSAFRLINWLGLISILVSVLAIASGMIDHGSQQERPHYQGVQGTR